MGARTLGGQSRGTGTAAAAASDYGATGVRTGKGVGGRRGGRRRGG